LNKKLKIAIIGSRGYPYVYSGYETLVKELSERLVKKGHYVRVYCHRSLFIEKPKFINGIELIYTPSVETKLLSQFINSFFSFIHVCFSKTDVVLTLNSANGPFGILTTFFGIKSCINVDGLEWLRPKWKGFGSYYFKIASKLATIFFDEIITDSIEMSKIYLESFNRKSTVISYGPTMIKTNKKEILPNYKLNEKEYYLIVGRMIPDNNAKLIIDGFLNSGTNKKLVIIGDVPYRDKYASQIKKIVSDKIVLTGYIKSQNQLSQFYKNCFGYIHGHEFGGTNPTMINALDLNCNILALKTKFNQEMLLNRKDIFFEKNQNSIKNSIINFEKNYKSTNNLNKKYNLPKKYDWSHIAKQYESLFFELIER
tara:strand:+ start:428 stop:1534 length:1107 start_codon:yes stop_codon:yes gene_type:complete